MNVPDKDRYRIGNTLRKIDAFCKVSYKDANEVEFLKAQDEAWRDSVRGLNAVLDQSLSEFLKIKATDFTSGSDVKDFVAYRVEGYYREDPRDEECYRVEKAWCRAHAELVPWLEQDARDIKEVTYQQFKDGSRRI